MTFGRLARAVLDRVGFGGSASFAELASKPATFSHPTGRHETFVEIAAKLSERDRPRRATPAVTPVPSSGRASIAATLAIAVVAYVLLRSAVTAYSVHPMAVLTLELAAFAGGIRAGRSSQLAALVTSVVARVRSAL